MTPSERLVTWMLAGFLMGGLVAAASGYGLLGVVITAAGSAIACAGFMVIRLSLEAAERRAHRPVVKRPRSHINQVSREQI